MSSGPATPEPGVVLASARRELARLPALLDTLLGGLEAATWRARPAPAEWSPVEIVCHLRDEEVEDFGARVRVIVAGGTGFAPIDPERWAVERRYREADPREALASLNERRAASLAFLDTITADRLTATVAHPRAGPLSGPSAGLPCEPTTLVPFPTARDAARAGVGTIDRQVLAALAGPAE